jgi:hypothetical protein
MQASGRQPGVNRAGLDRFDLIDAGVTYGMASSRAACISPSGPARDSHPRPFIPPFHHSKRHKNHIKTTQSPVNMRPNRLDLGAGVQGWRGVPSLATPKQSAKACMRQARPCMK